MTTQLPITISKPIGEVVKYVINAEYWPLWASQNLIKATQEADGIKATYKGGNEITWSVSHYISGEAHIVIFTAKADASVTVEYIFTSREKRASTGVARNEASPLEDISTDSLSALKKAVEKKKKKAVERGN